MICTISGVGETQMWKQLKDRVLNLFKEEQDDHLPLEHKPKTQPISRKQQSVHTKVTYQYPRKTPFRFPVIGDEVTKQKREKTDIPAYQRNRVKSREISNDQTKRENTSTYKQPAPKIEKRTPFTPSQVASPIYGYRDRKKNKELDNIPAFIRNKQKDNQSIDDDINIEKEYISSQETKVNTLKTTRDTKKSNDRQPIVKEENAKQSPVEKTTVNDNVVSQEANKPQASHSISDKDLIKRDNKKESRQASQRRNTKRQKKVHHKSQRTSTTSHNRSQRREIPFNVIMTPLDKKKLRDKQKIEQRQQRLKQENMKSKINEQHDEKDAYHVPIYLLDDPTPVTKEDRLWVREQQNLLEKTLKHFNVQAKVVHASQGPSVTRFEVQPALGVKVSRVRNLSDDIKMNMSAKDIRIEAPIPGKNTIGIEVPNLHAQTVALQEILETDDFKHHPSPLTVGLGLNVEGKSMITNISNMPHGLIAGATGSGKSVCINTILISLIYKSSYKDVKLLLIDPKMVELAPYNEIPHLVSPVITDVKAATAALKWAVSEMEDRYEKFVDAGVRDIKRYNEKMAREENEENKMPFLVIVIDELADLMMASPQDVEDAICRIAQKARACGIHLLLATQRPSVDVITGLIKANIPSRIAFSVSSQVDSRTIIDTNGAERLLGKGDMLFIENGSGKSIRLQGAFVSDEEIERVTHYVRKLAEPTYAFEQEQLLRQVIEQEDVDELFDEVLYFLFNQQHVSTSLLQRNFRIGYNRAARLIDTLENKGIISGPNGSKPRDVLLTTSQLEAYLQGNNEEMINVLE